ncbi:MAG: ATP-binding protein, partial [Acidobacteriota bacterium]
MATNNLPVPLTRFIGRDEEINEMLRLSVQTRLLTLTGSGGCGKTRLALEVATRLGDSFEPNVAWVDLAPVADAALVQQTVAHILDVPEFSDQPLTRSVANYLRPRNFLLVLDNCEHLIDACAQLVEELLRTCPHLLILATSREALNISGETAWRVPPLQVIDPRTTAAWEPLLASESVRLFIERARSVEHDFVGDQQNARAIAQICHRLDGMPLAIELAAARVKALPVEQIAARLDDRFRLLNLGTRTAPPRHQTLRAVIDWSYDLLSPAEKTLFRRLAVFAGGWTLEAAEVVCSGEGLASYAILDLVEHLVDKSVVVAQNKVARYHLLETIRQYGHEKLLESAEAETSHQRHLEWLIQFAKEADPKLRGPEMNIWARRLDAELDNIRTALEWGFEHAQISNVAELVAALDYYFFLRGNYGEAKRWAERVAQLTRGAPADIHAKALFAWGFMLGRLGDSESAEPVLQQALALYRALDNPERVAYILNLLGVIASFRDNIDRAEQYFQESLTLRRAIGDKWGIAHTLQNFGLLAERRGDYAGAKAIYEQVL